MTDAPQHAPPHAPTGADDALSVVMPTAGRSPALGEALAALAAQRDPRLVREVLVVLDGEAPGAREVVGRAAAAAPFPVRALAQAKAGAGAARNFGIARATARVVLMLDDDVIADAGLVAAHLRWHAARSDTVVTGALPVAAAPRASLHHEMVRGWWARVLEEKARAGHEPTFRDFVTGNVSAPRARLLEAGGFDPSFAGYGREDYELGYRLLRMGLRFVHDPEAVALHRYAKPPLDWARQHEAEGRADVLFARKHPELTADVMTLYDYPPVPWVPAAVRLAEALLTRADGRRALRPAWRRAAKLAAASHYWQGVRGAVRDGDELRGLVRARETRAARGGR